MTKEIIPAKGASLPATYEEAAAMAATQFAGGGMETVGADDLLIPRIAIIQNLSPQRRKTHVKFIDGAEEGDICDTGMGRVYDSVEFMPVIYRKQWIEWSATRDQGGPVNFYNTPAILEQCTINPETRKPCLPSGNSIIETPQFTGFLMVTDDTGKVVSYSRAFIAMPGSQRRKAKRWLNLATSVRIPHPNGGKVTAPLFWQTYALGSTLEHNDEGEWHGWTIEPENTLPEIAAALGVPFSDIMEDAQSFARAIADGHQRLDMAQEADPDEGEAM